MKVSDLSVEELERIIEAVVKRSIREELDPDVGLEMKQSFIDETLSGGNDFSDTISLSEVVNEYRSKV